ncbi:MAG: metallophosphoesterase [Pseudomonadota bacterium]
MKIVFISDTHGQHEDLISLSGDVLIHCGDFDNIFEPDKHIIEKVDDWFGRQDFDRIFCVGGNHDHILEDLSACTPTPFQNAEFLHSRSYEFGGLKFYGSSWVPQLSHHAFFARPDTLKTAWAEVPKDTDILVTHTPPAGTLDVSSKGQSLGCRYLASHIQDLNLKIHCFGHVHAAAGYMDKAGTTCINASLVNSRFEIVHPPISVEVTL